MMYRQNKRKSNETQSPGNGETPMMQRKLAERSNHIMPPPLPVWSAPVRAVVIPGNYTALERGLNSWVISRVKSLTP